MKYCLYTTTGDIVCRNSFYNTYNTQENFTASSEFNLTSANGILSTNVANIMSPGDRVDTPNKNFYLEYAMDGKLYVKDKDNKQWWSSPVGASFPNKAIVQGDGNFVLYRSSTAEKLDEIPYWATNTAGSPGPVVLELSDGGTFRLLDRSRNRLWSATLSSFRADGGSITSIGNDRIHIFRDSSVFKVEGEARNMSVLVVGGGGGGAGFAGIGGGGGGGQVWYQENVRFDPGNYNIIVGNGGGQNQNGDFSHIQKGNTNWIWAAGGGAGAQVWKRGNDGASGGGGSSVFEGTAGGNPTAFGTMGATGYFNNLSAPSSHNAGGGGGAGGAPEDINRRDLRRGGRGGDGKVINITGQNVYYGAGGGGGATIASWVGNTEPSLGGLGGGGAGGYNRWYDRINPTAGMANTGSGGGGSAWDGIGGPGGSGIVIIRYSVPS